MSNIQTLIVSELEDDLVKDNQQKKYDYKINTNLSYGFLKNRILDLFLTSKSMEKSFEDLKQLYKENLIPIRPNRSFERTSTGARLQRVPTYLCELNKAFATRLI